MKKREIKTVSFSLESRYERKLYEYATQGERGDFSPYIKRLIERDRDGWVRMNSVVAPEVVTDETEDVREAARSYL